MATAAELAIMFAQLLVVCAWIVLFVIIPVETLLMLLFVALLKFLPMIGEI